MARKDESSEPKTGFDSWKQSSEPQKPKKKGRKGARRSSREGMRAESQPVGSSSADKKDAARAGSTRGSKRRKRKLPASMRKHVVTLVALVVLLVLCTIGFFPPSERITQGLDIQGGVSVILTASKSDGSQPTADEMSTATSIVQRRVNSLGASEATVQQQGTNSILVQIPGATDADSAVETIGKTGKLEFVRLDEIGDADALARLNGSSSASDVTLTEGTYTPFMDGSYIESTSVGQASSSTTGAYSVNIKLNSKGSKIFSDVTTELAPTNGRIAIVLDGVVASAPAVQEPITGGQVSITGNFSIDEAQQLKTVLDSGSLPVNLTYSESRVVGPTLGQDSLTQGIFAIALGVAIVIVYLFIFYQGLGLLTMGSLVSYGIIYLGILALLSHFGAFSLTLPGLAATVLSIGSAADSSILVLERFREEIRMGRSVRQASVSGVKHGIATSLDADAVTLVTALALFFVAVGSVKGFGLTLMLGVACDLITMFAFKAPALRLLAPSIEKHPGFWGVKHDLDEAEARKEARTATRDVRVAKGGVAHA